MKIAAIMCSAMQCTDVENCNIVVRQNGHVAIADFKGLGFYQNLTPKLPDSLSGIKCAPSDHPEYVGRARGIDLQCRHVVVRMASREISSRKTSYLKSHHTLLRR